MIYSKQLKLRWQVSYYFAHRTLKLSNTKQGVEMPISYSHSVKELPGPNVPALTSIQLLYTFFREKWLHKHRFYETTKTLMTI